MLITVFFILTQYQHLSLSDLTARTKLYVRAFLINCCWS